MEKEANKKLKKALAAQKRSQDEGMIVGCRQLFVSFILTYLILTNLSSIQVNKFNYDLFMSLYLALTLVSVTHRVTVQ